MKSSARNQFSGTASKVMRHGSAERLDLKLGEPTSAIFKISAIIAATV